MFVFVNLNYADDYIDFYSTLMRSKLTRQEHFTFNTKVDSMVDCGPERFTIGLDAHYSNMCTHRITIKQLFLAMGSTLWNIRLRSSLLPISMMIMIMRYSHHVPEMDSFSIAHTLQIGH